MSETFNPKQDRYTAFDGPDVIVEGPQEVVHRYLFDRQLHQALIFEDWSGKQIDFDLTSEPVQAKATGPGRPKLGVKPREITLLPRHWEWLDTQPGGASAKLRQLVEAEMKAHPDRHLVRASQDSCFRFMAAMAGDLAGYEDASRAVTRKDRAEFEAAVRYWPHGIRGYALYLANEAFIVAPST